uniref:5'-nucleotidase domain-containing protein 3 n=1 Tax=Panagrolaimus superbus TaxID=310955 RepID=A0A914XWH5_9BILA
MIKTKIFFLNIFRSFSSKSGEDIPTKLRAVYVEAKAAVNHEPYTHRVNPRGVFTNYELNLRNVGVYGFDYDYTLAIYTKNLNNLVYTCAMNRMVKDLKYPKALLEITSDLSFAIRGLHYDIEHCVLLKVDAYNQIQRGTVYRGKRKLSDEEVKDIYGDFSVPDNKGKNLPQLIDLFSLPWAGLLSRIVQYFDDRKLAFDPVLLYEDVADCVQRVHASGEMYQCVMDDLPHYVHKNEGLSDYLHMLRDHGKELFIITNSPFQFINSGMTFMLGEDWRKIFKYIVVSARKPTFFQGKAAFRRYNEETNGLDYEKVTHLYPDQIYSGGNMKDFSEKAEFKSRGVLYFGDHIYTDLADPILQLGWHTAAIVPELAREIRVQNLDTYHYIIVWLETLTQLIETYQKYGDRDPLCCNVITEWIHERAKLRDNAKAMFNEQFGSMFRTHHSSTYFYRHLNRLADIYTSRLPNMSTYGPEHTFFPRRNALPHESKTSVVEIADEIVTKTESVHELSKKE